MEFLSFHAILSLDLCKDRTNVERFALHVRYNTIPVDTMAQLQRMFNGEEPDLNAQVRFNIVSISRTPISPDLQQIAEHGKQRMTETEREEKFILPILLTNFHEEEIVKRKETGKEEVIYGHSFVFASTVTERQLGIIKTNPHHVIRTSTLTNQKIDLTPSVILL